MVMLKKVVSKYGSGAHIVMPKNMLGAEAYVICDDDFEYFRDLIRNAYLLSKMGDTKIVELEKRLNKFEADIQARVALIERILPSTSLMRERSNSDTQNSDNT